MFCVGRFAECEPLEASDLKKLATPKATQTKANWANNVYQKWRVWKENITNALIPPLSEMTLNQIDKTLAQFTREVRKENGDRYPGRSLKELILSLQKHLELNGTIVRLLESNMEGIRAALDLEMKISTRMGLGLTTNQAAPVSSDIQDQLWQNGVLGDSDPKALVRAVFYLVGVNFGVRGGDEQRGLSSKNFEFGTENGRHKLTYRETVSKTFKGGLRNKHPPRQAVVFETDGPRCIVKLMRKYLDLTPPGATEMGLYLKPLEKPREDVWYSKQYLGHNTLKKMVSEIMQEGGCGGLGKFTNHSLRATTATRLYQANVDEQLIAEQTGHKSLDSLRRYKRTSPEQRQIVSNILNACPPCESQNPAPEKKQKVESDDCVQSGMGNSNSTATQSTSNKNTSPVVFNVYGGEFNLNFNM